MSWSKRYKMLKDTIEKYPVSGIPKDLFMEYFFIDSFSFYEIIEFGAGTGNWSVLIDNLTRKGVGLSKSERQRAFHQVENFDYTSHLTMSHVYEKENWPTTPEDLRNNCIQASLELTTREIKSKYYFENINDLLKRNLYEDFNVIRIDCDIDWDLFWKWLPHNTAEDFIIIVDDIAPNYCYERFYNMMKQSNDIKNIKPVWLGINTGIWCSSNLTISDTVNYAAAELTHLYDVIRIRDGILITR